MHTNLLNCISYFFFYILYIYYSDSALEYCLTYVCALFLTYNFSFVYYREMSKVFEVF
jgi:hypothetical protein